MTNEPWRRYPDVKPQYAGEYIVTTRRPTAGRWVTMIRWDGKRWTQMAQVTAWMPKPAAYRADE